ncbi:MAG: hypothetical protein M3461_11490 [Pseudomonadota bacterium]|nr:hypothetical protein [Pseudomonadota bacterium]
MGGRYKDSLDPEHYLFGYYRYRDQPGACRDRTPRTIAGRAIGQTLSAEDAVVTEHAEYTALGGSLATRCDAYGPLFRVDLR